MTFFCPICWKEVSKDDIRCPYCGSDITEHEKKSFEEKLINALRHPEPETAQRAIWILGKLKSIPSVERLSLLFTETDNPFLKIAILNSLHEIGTPDAIDLIVSALDAAESMVRKKAGEIVEKRIVDRGR